MTMYYGSLGSSNRNLITGEKLSKRQPFKISTKKKEWNKAAGRSEGDFKKTSKCRVYSCRRVLVWGSGAYDFDHKDNNPANNSQRNCWLVCKNCHGKHTKLGKKRVTTFIGTTYKTYKKKVGYKKTTKPKPKRRKGKRKRRSNGYNQFGFTLPKLY